MDDPKGRSSHERRVVWGRLTENLRNSRDLTCRIITMSRRLFQRDRQTMPAMMKKWKKQNFFLSLNSAELRAAKGIYVLMYLKLRHRVFFEHFSDSPPTQSLCWRDIGMVPLPSSCLLAPILQVRRCRHPFILWLSSYSYQTLTKLSHPVVVRPHLCTPLVTLGWHWFWSRSWFLFLQDVFMLTSVS